MRSIATLLPDDNLGFEYLQKDTNARRKFKSDYLPMNRAMLRSIQKIGHGLSKGLLLFLSISSPVFSQSTPWTLREPANAYKAVTPIPNPGKAALLISTKNYLSDTNPAALPAPAVAPAISLFASPGEIEPATFLILAPQALQNVAVEISNLTRGGVIYSANNITVRKVARVSERRTWGSRYDDTEITDRFLPRWTPQTLEANEFREVWLSFEIPKSFPPGTYTGEVTVKVGTPSVTRAFPISLEILPLRLIEPAKKLGTYYNIRSPERWNKPARLQAELMDMRRHNISNLYAGLAMDYAGSSTSTLTPSFLTLERGLNYIRNAGFPAGSTILIDSGLTWFLKNKFGYSTLVPGQELDFPTPQTLESIRNNADFQKLAEEGTRQLLEFNRQKFPEYRLVLTQMDEIFNANRLPLYIELSRPIKRVAGSKLAVTFHTNAAIDEAKRAELDPYVDIRINHGYTFEWWLSGYNHGGQGHSMDDYQAELTRSGDEAWLYHNIRGTYHTAEWQRIINGVFLWSSPFTSHIPYTYQYFYGNPFDDTDGPIGGNDPGGFGHDFELSAPSLTDDPADLVPTKVYEALREGGDDLHYIATLEKAINDAPESMHDIALRAQTYLTELKRTVQNITPLNPLPVPTGTPPPCAIDPDTNKCLGYGGTGTAREAPITYALASKFSAEEWQQKRREIADLIIALLGNADTTPPDAPRELLIE